MENIKTRIEEILKELNEEKNKNGRISKEDSDAMFNDFFLSKETIKIYDLKHNGKKFFILDAKNIKAKEGEWIDSINSIIKDTFGDIGICKGPKILLKDFDGEKQKLYTGCINNPTL